NIVWSTVFAFDTTKFDSAPTTMADFFDTDKFPGKRGLRKNPKANLEMALMADGVAAADVYDTLSTAEGVDRAFAKLSSIKDDIVWWEAGAQPPQMLADGEVAMSTAYNGRLFNAIVNEGKPFEIVWDGQIFDLDLWVVPKGAPNYDDALEFLAFSTDTKRLADQTNYISYGPARKSSSALIKPELLPHMPTAPANFTNPLQNDFQWWADNQEDMNERFNAWLAS
ncbi:MAG: extracellular solute-binding protein, partial [Alphaproteobacteria bacterium]